MIKILLIDDVDDNLISLKAIIHDAFPDSEMLTALDGQSGIELAVSEYPHVILLDIIMPEMDGFEVCRRLKSDLQTRDIPVVFLTAIKGNKETRIKALELGAEGFLSKPIDETELIAQIRAMVKIKEANEQKRDEKVRLKKLVYERTHKLEMSKIAAFNLLDDLKAEIEVRRKAEETLRESEQRFRHISSSISDISYSCKINPEGVSALDWLYGATERITGYTTEEMFEMKCWGKLVVEDDFARFKKFIIELAPGSSEICELRLIRKDGSVVWIQASAECVNDNDRFDGNIIYGCLVDISERKRIESELIAAKEKAEENDRLKSAFLANMSHEIRTPLNSIIGFSDLMSDADFEASQCQQYIRLINNSGNNLLKIINDIIDLAKIEAGQVRVHIQPHSVNKLIRDIRNEYSHKATEKGIELKVDHSHLTDEIFIESDELRLRQILINFVGNALKFTNEGFVEIGAKISGEFVQFHVKDTGIGIPNEFHKHIFERFNQVDIGTTRKYGGNGLGLSISKSLVELLGGKIWMESEPGKGSVFYFAMPKCN